MPRNWGSSLQLGHLPSTGIQPRTLQFTVQHSTHWARPARAKLCLFNYPHSYCCVTYQSMESNEKCMDYTIQPKFKCWPHTSVIVHKSPKVCTPLLPPLKNSDDVTHIRINMQLILTSSCFFWSFLAFPYVFPIKSQCYLHFPFVS